MRIRVRDEKIIKAVKKLEGIDIILRTVEDAKEAMRLILRRTERAKTPEFTGLKDIHVAQVVEYSNTAVDYQTFYEIEFIGEGDHYADLEIALIRELQSIFEGK